MKKYAKWIFLVLTVLMMAFIFIMSSHTADESTNESRGIDSIIGRILWRDFDEWSPSDRLDFVTKIDGTVRTLGHFIEFAVLGSLIHLTLRAWDVKSKIALPASFGGGVFYALTDEFHQMFVDGRAAQIGDLLVDSAGVAFGCLIVWIILTAAASRRAKKGKADPSAAWS
ncbi:MAG: VanZ family protein [Clostridia bacterium]|nr:VanZ family protein [Clostridia bacterium]